ncbi:MAG: ribosome small subunit-dependent GTPase A [Peptostreptococcaceae bacterium]|nr:ribosome small subunit-dependent GTPase A [Peptostreptococcaceae bacterium]
MWRCIIKGLVIKKIADFFYVEYENKIYEAKPRGSFKKDNTNILVGDYVDILVLDEENKKAVLEKVYDRKNMLVRPNVSNITKLILLFSVKDPKLNAYLIDSFLVMANKNNIGIQDIRTKIKNDITVIAGPSGAGKSSLINKLSSEFNQATSSISMKLQKGKNTTTYATLLKMSKDSYIADTPGFTSLKILDIQKDELKDYFVEFKEHNGACKYANKCLHEHEPNCIIKEELEKENISKSRYESYIRMLNEIKNAEKRRKY